MRARLALLLALAVAAAASAVAAAGGMLDAVACPAGTRLDDCWACTTSQAPCVGADGRARSFVRIFESPRGPATYLPGWTLGLAPGEPPLTGLAVRGADGIHRPLLVLRNGARTDAFAATGDAILAWADGPADRVELRFQGHSLAHASGRARLEAGVAPANASVAWIARCAGAPEVRLDARPSSVAALFAAGASVWDADAGAWVGPARAFPVAWRPEGGCEYALELSGAASYTIRHALVDDTAPPPPAPPPTPPARGGAALSFTSTPFAVAAAARAIGAAATRAGLRVAWEVAAPDAARAWHEVPAEGRVPASTAARVAVWSEAGTQRPAIAFVGALAARLSEGGDLAPLALGPVRAVGVADDGRRGDPSDLDGLAPRRPPAPRGMRTIGPGIAVAAFVLALTVAVGSSGACARRPAGAVPRTAPFRRLWRGT